MAAGDWKWEHTVPPMRGGGRNWDSPGLRVQGELWTTTVELDLMGGDG